MSEEPRSAVYRASLLLGRVVVGGGRLVLGALPARARKAIDDRFFGAVFNVTRVTNDAYGWRPDTPPGGAPPPEHAGAEGAPTQPDDLSQHNEQDKR